MAVGLVDLLVRAGMGYADGKLVIEAVVDVVIGNEWCVNREHKNVK